MNPDRLIRSTMNPKNKPVVYMPAPFPPASIEYAKSKFELLQPGDADEDDILGRCEGILLRIAPVTRSMIEKAPKLKIISRNGVGYDAIDRAACEENSIAVTNMPGINSQAVAELALCLALSLSRRVPEVTQRMLLGERLTSIEAISPGLSGKVIGLIGMGDIARETARMFQSGFGCPIRVFSPTSDPNKWCDGDPSTRDLVFERVQSLDDLLSSSDVISVHCPLNESTRGLLGSKQFKMMRPEGILINTARGGIVDEEALYTALTDGVIGGAALDVWEIEPPTLDTHGKWLKLPNFIGLPHLAGSTEETQRLGCDGATDIVEEFLMGKGPARNRVY